MNLSTCDSCGQEMSGYSRRDLLSEGWKFHEAKRKEGFLMCGDCEQRYAQIRQQRAEEIASTKSSL